MCLSLCQFKSHTRRILCNLSMAFIRRIEDKNMSTARSLDFILYPRVCLAGVQKEHMFVNGICEWFCERIFARLVVSAGLFLGERGQNTGS